MYSLYLYIYLYIFVRHTFKQKLALHHTAWSSVYRSGDRGLSAQFQLIPLQAKNNLNSTKRTKRNNTCNTNIECESNVWGQIICSRVSEQWEKKLRSICVWRIIIITIISFISKADRQCQRVLERATEETWFLFDVKENRQSMWNYCGNMWNYFIPKIINNPYSMREVTPAPVLLRCCGSLCHAGAGWSAAVIPR